MLKGFGIFILVAVCGIFGVRASAFLRQRKRKLSEFALFIEECKDMMRLGRELSYIFESDRAKRLLNVSGYSVTVIDEGLTAEDKRLLTEFFSGLGMGDLQSTVALCENYREIVAKRAADAEKNAEEKSRLYSLLGLFSGIFLAIILI